MRMPFSVSMGLRPKGCPAGSNGERNYLDDCEHRLGRFIKCVEDIPAVFGLDFKARSESPCDTHLPAMSRAFAGYAYFSMEINRRRSNVPGSSILFDTRQCLTS